MKIRAAQKGDEFGIMLLIQALAEYEKAPNEVVNTAEALGIHLFEEHICEAILMALKQLKLSVLHCGIPRIQPGKENACT